MPLQPLQSQQDTELSIQFLPDIHKNIIKSLSQTGVSSSIIPYYVSTEDDSLVNVLTKKTGINLVTLDQSPYEGAITGALDQISKEIGFKFTRVNDPASAILGIYLIDGELPTAPKADGVSINFENSKSFWTDVFWNKAGIGSADPQEYIGTLLRHEIGHSFGFSHPANDGENPNFNTADTLMSYMPGWSRRDAYLPQSYNAAEVNVLKQYYGSTLSNLSAEPISLNIDKTTFSDGPNSSGDPGLRKSLWTAETYEDLGLSDAKDSSVVRHTNGADHIILGGGTYEARSGLGKDTYVITQEFIDNLTGFAVLSDFDPMRDKFVYANDVTDTSDFRFGSIGDIPALFNEDNLVAVFGIHDPYVSRPTLFQSTEAWLNDYQSQVSASLYSLLEGSSLFGL